MLFELTQKSLPDLPGAPFLDVLQQFRKQDLAVLYSGDGLGHSVIARRPLATFSLADESSRPHFKVVPDISSCFRETDDPSPLEQLDALFTTPYVSLAPLPLCGWIGQIGYDIGRLIEKIPSRAADDLRWPLLHWRLFDEYFLFDHAAKTWTLVTADWHGRTESPDARFSAMATLLNPPPRNVWPQPITSALLESMPREEYLAKVEKIKNYISAGDIYQANFAQRWKAQTFAKPLDIFLSLMEQTPAAYSALLTFGNRAAISASPELLLHRHQRELTTQPIKGTRPRDLADSAHDQTLHDDLLASEKDKAELAMIVDLLRNDLGRIAEFGSVLVESPRRVEKLPTLWHAVATIKAQLLTPNFHRTAEASAAIDPRHPTFANSWQSIIRALMPGGSITGAPKIRAMQIIEELEPTRRGLYCGSIAALSCGSRPQGRATLFYPTGTFNITIRTLQLIDNLAYLHAGSGIVADSDPQTEYEECLHKAAALFRALNLKIQNE